MIAFGTFGVVVAAVAVTLGRAGRNLRLDGSRTPPPRSAYASRSPSPVGFVALAAKIGLQIILGAFLAGAVLNLVDRDTASHPVFRSKLDALGYGFLIPVFFVPSGVEFDLGALTRSPSALARIPLLLLTLLIVRGAPAALYIRAAGRLGAVAARLLQATSLPVIVTAASIGLAIHAIAPVTASALVAAGLLSVLAFPLTALSVIRAGRIRPAAPHATPPDRGDHGPPPAFDSRPVQKEG